MYIYIYTLYMYNHVCIYIYIIIWKKKSMYIHTYIPPARNWTPTGKVAMPLLLGAAAMFRGNFSIYWFAARG